MKNSKKGFGALAVILILAIVIGVTWYALSQYKDAVSAPTLPSATSTQVESKTGIASKTDLEQPMIEEITSTTELKKYSNKEFSFSFTYPKDWITETESLVKEQKVNKELFSVVLASKDDFYNYKNAYEGGYDLLGFNVRVCESVNTYCFLGGESEISYKSLAEAIQTQLNKYKDSKNKFLSNDGGYKSINTAHDMVINGLQGYGIYEGGGYSSHFQIAVENPKTKKVYLLTIPGAYVECHYGDKCPVEPEISSQQLEILKSFKFE